MARMFVALNFPDPLCDQIAREAKSLARIDPLADFCPGTDLHLTLAFVGEATEAQAAQLHAALAPLGTLVPREIQTGYLEVFQRAGVLTLGIQPRDALKEVAKAVRRELRTLNLPFDERPFKPHITLARRWRRTVRNPVFTTFTLPLSRPVVMFSERDPRTNLIRYRQFI